MLFNNTKFHQHRLVYLVLKQKVVEEKLIPQNAMLWTAINHVVESLIGNHNFYKTLPESTTKLNKDDFLEEASLARLYAAKHAMRIVEYINEPQTGTTKQEITANAIWMLITLWHDLNDNKHRLLNSVEESILMDSFRQLIESTVYTAAEAETDKGEQRKLSIIYSRLFAPRCQRILPNEFKVPDPFAWKNPGVVRSRDFGATNGYANHRSTTRSRSRSNSRGRSVTYSVSSGRTITKSKTPYNQLHTNWRNGARTPRPTSRNRSVSRGRSPSPSGILKSILPNLARTRINARSFGQRDGHSNGRDSKHSNGMWDDLERKEKRLNNRIASFLNNWDPHTPVGSAPASENGDQANSSNRTRRFGG
jgi:hypothetical protein